MRGMCGRKAGIVKLLCGGLIKPNVQGYATCGIDNTKLSKWNKL